VPQGRAEHVGVQPAERGAFGGLGSSGRVDRRETSTAADRDELPSGDSALSAARSRPSSRARPRYRCPVRPPLSRIFHHDPTNLQVDSTEEIRDIAQQVIHAFD
jgi:hypothetical protein